MKTTLLTLAAALTLTSAASATLFDFRYDFGDGTYVQGSFTGDADPKRRDEFLWNIDPGTVTYYGLSGFTVGFEAEAHPTYFLRIPAEGTERPVLVFHFQDELNPTSFFRIEGNGAVFFEAPGVSRSQLLKPYAWKLSPTFEIPEATHAGMAALTLAGLCGAHHVRKQRRLK